MDAPEEVKQFGPGPQGQVRRWLTEIQIARRNDKPWRESGKKIWNKYKGTDTKRGAFNILWSNTEVLRPAIYNSLPQPDVRRRFEDSDPLGKCVAETLQRALEFSFETSAFDAQIQADVLDMLLAGRGVSRVRYIPSLVQVGDVAETGREQDEADTEHEALQGPQEELAWQQVEPEHVQWDDLVLGPGKSWAEVQWIAFRHDLTRDQIAEQFGEDIANRIAMKSSGEPEVQNLDDSDPVKRLFDTVEVWEVWDKQERQVCFYADAWREGPLKQVADPLKLNGFYPIPEPLRAVEDSTSQLPTPLYTLYREQAEELDRISIRINKIVDALKVRGLYDATLGNDISQLVRGADNDLVPATDVAAWIEKGGIDKAIWFLPIEQASNVLASLYQQREQCKTVIYELTGISDILRGSTQSDETATAQLLKHQWGTIRLQRMQRAVQTYIRDLVRLMGELIAEHFDVGTLAQMTGLNYPTEAQLQQQYHPQVLQAIQAQQPPPQPPNTPTWEQIKQVLADDLQRTYKIDIETDSTIAATQQTDMEALGSVMANVSKLIQELWPMVQSGALPFAAAKELVLTMARRARMGSAVEDALDQMQQPPPAQPDPKTQIPLQVEQLRQQGEQQRIQAEQAAKQAEIQADAQADLVRAHLDAWVAEQQQQAQAAQAAQQERLEQQTEMLRVANESHLEQVRLQVDGQLEALKQNMALLIAKLNNAAKIEVAEIAAATTLQTAQIGAAQQGAEE